MIDLIRCTLCKKTYENTDAGQRAIIFHMYYEHAELIRKTKQGEDTIKKMKWLIAKAKRVQE